ncbi:MAG TPA: hypothetical protein VF054_06400 [Micromonosporaceae bacterium]
MTVVRTGERYRWLVHSAATQDSAIARAAREFPDEEACRAAAAALNVAPLHAMTAIQQPDGRWRWRLWDADGHPLAESATAFLDARSCGAALLTAQRTLAGVTGPR